MPFENTLSYWERETFIGRPDVVVLGSGIVGLSAAIRLRELDRSLHVLVLERGALPAGASTRNAGFACFGSLTELLDDMTTRSEEEVLALVERRWQGLQRLRARVGDTALQYESLGGYEVFRSDEADIYQQCLDRMGFFNDRLAAMTGLAQTYAIADEAIPTFGFQGVAHLIHNRAEGQIHTGKMMEALLEKAHEVGVKILFGVEVKTIESQHDGVVLQTAQGWEIRAAKLLVATNGFARRLLPHLEVQPARNQVLITQPIADLPVRGCFHYDRGYYYFRDVGNRLLLGGGRNLDKAGETTDELGTTQLIQNALQRLLHEVILPHREAPIDTWWSGILGIGEEKKPIIKSVAPHLWVAVRLGGMGVAIGSLVGEEAATEML